MVPGLNQFPTLAPFRSKEILQPFNPTLACIMDKTLAQLIAFNNRLFFAPGFREFMKRNVIFPPGHRRSFLYGP